MKQTANSVANTTSKVPEITLLFWLIKIVATTLGETGGDALSMSMHLGYLFSTGIFAMAFALAVSAQISAQRFNQWLYWLTIVATTTVGTTLADFATRSLAIGYTGGSAMLLGLLLISLAAWRWTTGSIAVSSIQGSTPEYFYWVTIMFSQTLGTALGDWAANTQQLGYLGAATIFGTLLTAVAFTYAFTRTSHTALFWLAFVLTRPLGAVLGDFLDKPVAKGGLEWSRYSASAVLLFFMIACLLLFQQRPAATRH